MKKYYYYACGENVESIRFLDNAMAWKFVDTNINCDCVVETMEEIEND